MKAKLFICLLFYSFNISAQLAISSGEHFYISGNIQLTLNNANLVNNGNFTAGNSKVSFTGNNGSTISGSKTMSFYELEMDKSNSNTVTLQRGINVTNKIVFTSGYLNLGGYNIDLGTTGRLDGEKENSRARGNSGQILFTTNLNSPVNANPGNLGAIISSSRNLGTVTIRRGHQSQNINRDNSILRYYDILPSNNNNLNATLRFNYFEGELNGNSESRLVFFNTGNNGNWAMQGYTRRNVTANYVEKTGIKSFSRWTLSEGNNSFAAEDDLNGKIQPEAFNVWPNPFRDHFFVKLYTTELSAVNIRLFDSKGGLIKQQSFTLSPGNNQLRFETGVITNGVYTLQVSWNDQTKAVPLIKQ